MRKATICLAIFLLNITPAIAIDVIEVDKKNEFPTEVTVRHVLDCMSALGGLNDQNLYTCACRYDAIRTGMTFEHYEDGITYERNRAMPGEKGGFFRDNERGEEFYNVLLKVREKADSSCIVVKQVKRPTKPTSTQ